MSTTKCNDFIVGPMVLLGPIDSDGEYTDVQSYVYKAVGLKEPHDSKTSS